VMGLDAYRETGNEAEMGETWRLLAMALWGAGRDEDAIDAFHQARNACRRVRDLRQEAHAASALGDLLLDLRRLDEAIVAFRHAQALYRDIGDHDAEANCWFQHGVTLAEAGRAKLATAAFRRAQTLYRATDNHEREALCWLGVAAMLGNDNRDVEAQHARDEAEAAILRCHGERLPTDTR
jgi:tetratricopeptide (TPR) repeat protein